MINSLCESCQQMKEVVSGKGSRFLMCQKSVADNRFAKYPPQPVVKCVGFEKTNESKCSK
ncbi:MAG: hypothetical protein FJ267_16595 [Planctomycetes bacterium]|nr:hypothetical protein [Planctomycetota bacterium]